LAESNKIGEPIAYYLREANNLFKGVYFVPKPYEVKDEHGHINGETFSMKGIGYKPS